MMPFETSGVAFLIAAAGAEVVRPREAQPAHVARVDQIERAVSRLTRRKAVAEPFGTGLARGLQGRVVDGFGPLLADGGEGRKSESNGQQERQFQV